MDYATLKREAAKYPDTMTSNEGLCDGRGG